MIIVALLAVAVACALAATLVLVVVRVQGEDRRGSLPLLAPTRTARAVRRQCGLRVCSPDQPCLSRRPDVRMSA
jgi:hypothetical protein